MHWVYLAIATVFEIAFALCANAAKGFTRLWPSILTLVIGALGTFFLSLALITLDVGVGYAIWTGLGSVGIVLLGTLLFKERLDWRKVVGIAVVIVGVVGLELSGAAV
ncbi:DMT family transporter [Saccharothrix hoggarensis]|uniref:DMT family transporter n=1 Tax=Saccharothrix hoggarensis TaxID=913853 RepID=A0ABW3QQ85_9PSEU